MRSVPERSTRYNRCDCAPPPLTRNVDYFVTYFVTSAMKTPKGSSVTSVPCALSFEDDCGVATKLFRVAEAKPLSARLKVAFWGEDDMFSATNTAFPL